MLEHSAHPILSDSRASVHIYVCECDTESICMSLLDVWSWKGTYLPLTSFGHRCKYRCIEAPRVVNTSHTNRRPRVAVRFRTSHSSHGHNYDPGTFTHSSLKHPSTTRLPSHEENSTQRSSYSIHPIRSAQLPYASYSSYT